MTATAVAGAVLPTVASMAGAAMKRAVFPLANRHYREDDWDRYGYDERREPYFEDEERERRRERHRRMMDEYGDDGDGYD